MIQLAPIGYALTRALQEQIAHVRARHYNHLERVMESSDYGREKYVTWTSTITVSAVCLQEEVHQS